MRSQTCKGSLVLWHFIDTVVAAGRWTALTETACVCLPIETKTPPDELGQGIQDTFSFQNENVLNLCLPVCRNVWKWRCLCWNALL